MRVTNIWMWLLACGVIIGVGVACKGAAEKKKAVVAAVVVPSPPGYDLGAPVKYALGETLREISGITFLRGNADTLYAIEDEKGVLYYFRLGGGLHAWKFGGHGDYEDVTVLDDREFVVLRSDGSLFVFPVGAVGGKGGDGVVGGKGSAELGKKDGLVRAYKHILPAGEYEGLFGDKGGRLIALCKNCAIDDQSKEVSAYVLGYGGGGNGGSGGSGGGLVVKDHFKIGVPADKLTSIHKNIKFHPSCLARNPLTGEMYIISSVNKMLFVFDDKWQLKSMYGLDPVLFKQPEGLAFDVSGNMYISNEGGEGRANVLLFRYKK